MSAETICEGFQWVGQPFTSCDGCGDPFWKHALMEVDSGAGPFAPPAYRQITWRAADRLRRAYS